MSGIKQLKEKRDFESYIETCSDFEDRINAAIKDARFTDAYNICGKYYEYLWFTDVDDESELGKEMHYRRIGWICGITDFIDLTTDKE